MKKGIDVKIVTGSNGIPDLKLSPFWNDENLWKGKSEWRKAKSYDNFHTHFGDALELIIKAGLERQFNPIEDIDYIEIKDEPKLIENS